MEANKFRSAKNLKDGLDTVKGNRYQLKYITDRVMELDRGEIQSSVSAREQLYDAAKAIFDDANEKERLDYRANFSVIFHSAYNFEIRQQEPGKAKTYQELLDHALPSRKIGGLERKALPSHTPNAAVAVLLSAGLIFAMRSMTGNVVSSPVGIGGEIVGSVLVGTLCVGLVLLVLSRLTAKP